LMRDPLQPVFFFFHYWVSKFWQKFHPKNSKICRTYTWN
jgi:hypothetical protein